MAWLLVSMALAACFTDAAFVPIQQCGRSPLLASEHKSSYRGETQRYAISSSNHENDTTRRQFLQSQAATVAVALGAPLVGNTESGEYTRETKDFGYALVPPPGFETTKKPLPTHLDEINFLSSDVKGYQIGITVDPVRINSLKEFGTPEEVAARVVTAEVNRDGVFDVTLVMDPFENSETGGYEINYLSKEKRGNKHFLANILVKNGKLYVLTAQVLEDNYKEKEAELLKSVRSFRVTAS